MTHFEAFKRKAEHFLRILEARAEKHGGIDIAPIDIINQIEDYLIAIEITEKAIRKEINAEQWKDALEPLALGIDPVKTILQASLEEYFQEPITKLNDDTRQMWQKTIRYAQYGFLARTWMSIAVFLIGLFLFGISSWQMVFGNLRTDQLFGPGISFVGGISAMIAVIYSGPLKEIRTFVNDLGITSAAFIAYVHRVLEISHTFTYYYLKGKMSYEEMIKSDKLIADAMSSTIMMFHNYESPPITSDKTRGVQSTQNINTP
jgi:hypothetical protein